MCLSRLSAGCTVLASTSSASTLAPLRGLNLLRTAESPPREGNRRRSRLRTRNLGRRTRSHRAQPSRTNGPPGPCGPWPRGAWGVGDRIMPLGPSHPADESRPHRSTLGGRSDLQCRSPPTGEWVIRPGAGRAASYRWRPEHSPGADSCETRRPPLSESGDVRSKLFRAGPLFCRRSTIHSSQQEKLLLRKWLAWHRRRARSCPTCLTGSRRYGSWALTSGQ